MSRALAGSYRALLSLAVATLLPSAAHGHFSLVSPPSWRILDVYGNPEKLGPCGDEGDAPASGIVTPFAAGETITITLDETIFHPGHYRVALAINDRAALPAEPPVTPGATACGSVPVMEPPVFPVLLDGALTHTDPFSSIQSFEVTLPSDVSCSHCTLQVLEFMSDHPEPCFYHHCADISISAAPTGCQSDGECADADACTRDRCDGGTCEHPPLTLADVDTGFLGTVDVPACSAEDVPPAIGVLFEKAGLLVTRAVEQPSKAARLLHRASKRLRRAGHKLTKMDGERVSADCASALADAVDRARSLVSCVEPTD